MEALFGRVDPRQARGPADAAVHVASALLAPGTVEVLRDGPLLLGMSRVITRAASQSARIGGTPDGGVRVAVNGEITNFAVLASAWTKGEAGPRPANDADLVAALYRLDCDRFAARLAGTFQLVLWDGPARRLLLVCDRSAGMKPFYYCQRGGVLLFGSSVKVLLAQPDAPRAVNAEALSELLLLGYVTAPDTVFRDVKVLAGGQQLAWHDANVAVTRYAARGIHTARRLPWEEAKQRYREALDTAVADAVVEPADAPPVLLSGGVDSASLVALLRRRGHRRVVTVSLHLGDPRHNERDMSRRVAVMFETEHHEITHLGSECLSALPEIVWFQEAPGTESHPTFWLGRAVRRLGPVALAGMGNDLIWGRYFGRNPLGPAGRLVPGFVERRFLAMRRRVDRRLVSRLLGRRSGRDGTILRKLSRRYVPAGTLFSDTILLEGAAYGDDFVDRDLGKLMVDASSLFVRMPFADPALAALVDSLPLRYKFDPPRRSGETKVLFKRVLEEENMLPPEIVRQPKRWMVTPTADWLRTDWRAAVERLLLHADARGGQYFDRSCVRGLWEEHGDGVRDHTVLLMLLLTFELWHRLFIEPTVPQKPELSLADFAARGQ